MEEGVIASWLKKEGDEVSSGDILAEVETDKATMELESYQDGTLLHIGVKEQEAVPVDGVIAIIGEKEEDISALLKEIASGGNGHESEGDEKTLSEKDSDESQETSGGKGENSNISDIHATAITMPKMSDTMEEGVIASWLKKEGDEISSGDILAEVETDKATMELEAYEEGTLLHIAIKEGESVPVDGIIAIVGEKGADYQSLIRAHQSGTKKAEGQGVTDKQVNVPAGDSSADSIATIPEEKPAEVGASNGVATENGRLLASPLARNMAKAKGIDLSSVKGSGDGGRIIKRDIENFEPAQQAPKAKESTTQPEAGMDITLPPVVGEEKTEEVKLSQMRKIIAKRLAQSKYTAPHFYLTMEINMGRAMEARASMNAMEGVKISFNDLIIRAVAATLKRHSDVNVTWAEDRLLKHQHIHIGVAVAVPEGLMVPVIRYADSKSLSHISAEIKDLAGKARDKKLQPEEMQGNTFTISNLGMFGIEEFTAIINPPDSCILAVGGIKETVIVENGEMKPGHTMKVTMSCDHRAVDGAVGAAFLKTLKELIEDPVRILV